MRCYHNSACSRRPVDVGQLISQPSVTSHETHTPPMMNPFLGSAFKLSVLTAIYWTVSRSFETARQTQGRSHPFQSVITVISWQRKLGFRCKSMANAHSATTVSFNPLPAILLHVLQLSDAESASKNHNKQRSLDWSILRYVTSNTIFISISHLDHNIPFQNTRPFLGWWGTVSECSKRLDRCRFFHDLKLRRKLFEKLLELGIDGRETGPVFGD
jgi:hypothetical protein